MSQVKKLQQGGYITHNGKRMLFDQDMFNYYKNFAESLKDKTRQGDILHGLQLAQLDGSESSYDSANNTFTVKTKDGQVWDFHEGMPERTKSQVRWGSFVNNGVNRANSNLYEVMHNVYTAPAKTEAPATKPEDSLKDFNQDVILIDPTNDAWGAGVEAYNARERLKALSARKSDPTSWQYKPLDDTTAIKGGYANDQDYDPLLAALIAGDYSKIDNPMKTILGGLNIQFKDPSNKDNDSNPATPSTSPASTSTSTTNPAGGPGGPGGSGTEEINPLNFNDDPVNPQYYHLLNNYHEGGWRAPLEGQQDFAYTAVARTKDTDNRNNITYRYTLPDGTYRYARSVKTTKEDGTPYVQYVPINNQYYVKDYASFGKPIMEDAWENINVYNRGTHERQSMDQASNFGIYGPSGVADYDIMTSDMPGNNLFLTYTGANNNDGRGANAGAYIPINPKVLADNRDFRKWYGQDTHASEFVNMSQRDLYNLIRNYLKARGVDNLYKSSGTAIDFYRPQTPSNKEGGVLKAA